MLPWLSLISAILLALALAGSNALVPEVSKQRDDKNLARLGAQTKQFITSHNRTPHSAAELRSFIRSRGVRSLPLYDSHGHALLYQRFDQFNFLVRSLGANEIEDSIGARDDSVYAKIPSPAPVSVRYLDDGSPFYPHLNLLGKQQGALIAWIAVDRERQQKKLVLRSSDDKTLVMVAPQNRVDEFLWLESADAIVYTASDHDDAGLYLWQVKTGRITSLSSKGFVSQDSGADDARQSYIALKAFDPKARRLTYYQLDSSSDALDPARFFSASHEKIIQFSEDFSRHEALVQLAAFRPLPLERTPQPLNREVEIAPGNSRAEAMAWQQVLSAGTVSDVLESWQRYSLAHTASPLYPYSLWGLGTIYNQAYQLYAAKQNPGAEQLQRFGMQISLALSTMTTAPAYLRAFGKFNFTQLQQAKVPTLPLATITADPSDDD